MWAHGGREFFYITPVTAGIVVADHVAGGAVGVGPDLRGSLVSGVSARARIGSSTFGEERKLARDGDSPHCRFRGRRLPASYEPLCEHSWRSYLDSEASWSAEATELVEGDPAFGLQNGWYEDPSNWETFNQFFSRYLSSPAARPIASPNEDAVVASYADAVPMGTWAIDSDSDILDPDGVAIKSMTIRNVAELIGEDSQYRDAFADGTLTHSFLDVTDYHRYHFPVSGTILEARIIQGINPTGGETSWDPDERRVVFDPSTVGWQTLETRGCVILETSDYGLVALLPVGMAAVGSVNLESTVTAGTQVRKGDMLGYFLFGGSDFIMLFQDEVDFTLDAPGDGQGYEHVLMGERLGHMTRR